MNKNRVLSLVLAVLMLTALVLPTGAFADDGLFEEESYFEEEPYFEEEQIFEDDFSYEEESFINEADEFEYAEDANDELFYEEENVNEGVDESLIEEAPVAEPEEEAEALELQDNDTFESEVTYLIENQPVDFSGPVGGTATFTVMTSEPGLSYQWQASSDGGTTWKNSKMSGYNTSTLTVPIISTRNGYQFHCIVTKGTDFQTSNPATLTVGEPAGGVNINTQPESQTAAAGAKVTFNVKASGGTGTLSYQWQARTSATGEWKNSKMSGYNTDTLTVDVIASRNGYQFRCIVTDAAGNNVTSNAATLNVGEPAGGVNIDTQPESQTAAAGAKVAFNVKASGGTGTLSYQWQARTSSTATWKNSKMSGYNTDTLTVDVIASRNGYQFRCIVTDAAGNNVTSNAATLNVGEPAGGVNIDTQPESQTAAAGAKVAFNVKASGGTGTLSYQWQARTSSTATWKNSKMSGYNTDTLTVDVIASRNGYQFRCIVTDAAGNNVTSNAATLNVGEPAGGVNIDTQPESQTAAAGAKVTFNVKASGGTGTLSYQWQARTSSTATWKNSKMSGYNTDTLTVDVTASRNGYQFRCIVTDSASNSVTSNSATLTVGAPAAELKIDTEPEDQTAGIGDKATFTVQASGGTGTLKYQWQARASATGEWKYSKMSGYNTNTLTVDVIASRNGYQFRCIVADEAAQTVTSKAVTLSVETDVVENDVVYTKLEDGTYGVKAYNGTAASVKVLDTINGAAVTQICENAFAGNTTLTSVELPNSIVKICARAFSGCTNLSSMNCY